MDILILTHSPKSGFWNGLASHSKYFLRPIPKSRNSSKLEENDLGFEFGIVNLTFTDVLNDSAYLWLRLLNARRKDLTNSSHPSTLDSRSNSNMDIMYQIHQVNKLPLETTILVFFFKSNYGYHEHRSRCHQIPQI